MPNDNKNPVSPAVLAGPARPQNAATIRVMYPDGCKQRWETRRDAPLANDAVAFSKWLHEIADTINEQATTLGRCAKEDKREGADD